MRMKEFKQSVIESLGHYVYCLVDPRDNRIFYIGEGCGNSVFNHAYDALNDNLQSLKLDVIRDIISQDMEVKYGAQKGQALRPSYQTAINHSY